MTFINMQRSDGPLLGHFDQNVKRFLGVKGNDISGSEIMIWLENSQRLIDQFRSDSSFYDYTFIVLPAFKALEKWLLDIAPFLGISTEKIQVARDLGSFKFLKEDKIGEIVDEIIEKLNEIDDQRKINLKDSIVSLNSLLKNYRHELAHCSRTIQNVHQAEDKIATIRERVNSITELLIREKIITLNN